jgi:hypothetical protein
MKKSLSTMALIATLASMAVVPMSYADDTSSSDASTSTSTPSTSDATSDTTGTSATPPTTTTTPSTTDTTPAATMGDSISSDTSSGS